MAGDTELRQLAAYLTTLADGWGGRFGRVDFGRWKEGVVEEDNELKK